MTRQEAIFWCGVYGVEWPKRGEVTDKDRALDECDIALAGVHKERAGDIMQVLYRELDSGDAKD